MRSLFLLLLLPILGAGCAIGPCVSGTGEAERRELQVAPFDGFVAQGSMDVRFSQGPQRVEVEAQPEIADLLETDVKDGIWTIRTESCYHTSAPFVVHITMPTVRRVHVQGSGHVMATNAIEADDIQLRVQGSGDLELRLRATSVDATIQGSGDMRLSGMADKLNATVQGSGDIQAERLMVKEAEARVQGSGNIAVHATGNVDAAINGSGDIIVSGSPQEVHEKVNGSGNVRRKP